MEADAKRNMAQPPGSEVKAAPPETRRFSLTGQPATVWRHSNAFARTLFTLTFPASHPKRFISFYRNTGAVAIPLDTPIFYRNNKIVKCIFDEKIKNDTEPT